MDDDTINVLYNILERHKKNIPPRTLLKKESNILRCLYNIGYKKSKIAKCIREKGTYLVFENNKFYDVYHIQDDLYEFKGKNVKSSDIKSKQLIFLN